jgi:hypothetical protein
LQLPADAPLELRPFPKPRKPIEVLLARLQGEEETEAEVGLRESAWLSALRPVVKLVRLATQAGNPDEALRAPVSVEAGKIQLQ